MAVIDPTILPFPSNIDRDYFGAWLSGFCDGESCFMLRFVHKYSRGNGSSGSARFIIGLRADDLEVVKLIRSYWECGSICFRDNKKNTPGASPYVEYNIQRADHLMNILVPHFTRFPLFAKKRRDFEIWKQGVAMCYKVSYRPLVYWTGARSGRRDKWTPEEKAEFDALCTTLKAQRIYEAPALPLPAASPESNGHSQNLLFD